MNDREAITQLIGDMSNAVLERWPDELLNYFHADAVLVAPRFEHDEEISLTSLAQ